MDNIDSKMIEKKLDQLIELTRANIVVTGGILSALIGIGIDQAKDQQKMDDLSRQLLDLSDLVTKEVMRILPHE